MPTRHTLRHWFIAAGMTAALFAVLAVEQWRNAHSVAPLWVAVLSYAIAWALLPQQALLSAIGLSVLTGLVWRQSTASEVRP